MEPIRFDAGTALFTASFPGSFVRLASIRVADCDSCPYAFLMKRPPSEAAGLSALPSAGAADSLGDTKLRASRQAGPLLRWVGGKQRLVPKLLEIIPEGAVAVPYREPFFGAGSLFFALQPARATLSDSNGHLIECYLSVRDRPALVASYLQRHRSRSSRCHYYEVRDEYNSLKPSVAQAARFIYLNQTCFNGVFRVNKRGYFNVPYGLKETPHIPSIGALRAASAALMKAELKVCDFETALSVAEKGDFIYLDPPYPPLNGTSFFTHYTADRFSEDDQRRLADATWSTAAKGCRVLMTNADTKLIRGLYKGFKFGKIQVTRWVSCRNEKHQVCELIITNF
jgi:DNA adenine methylase